jgi:hypothetical protein
MDPDAQFETLAMYFQAHNPPKASPANVTLVLNVYKGRDEELCSGLAKKYGETLRDFCRFSRHLTTFFKKYNPPKASTMNMTKIMQHYGRVFMRTTLYAILEQKYGVDPRCMLDITDTQQRLPCSIEMQVKSPVHNSQLSVLREDSFVHHHLKDFQTAFLSVETASLCSTSAPSSNCSSPSSTASWVQQWEEKFESWDGNVECCELEVEDLQSSCEGNTSNGVDLTSLAYCCSGIDVPTPKTHRHIQV